jgi:hypothetical protein
MSQEPDPRTPPPLSADQATMLLGMEATKRRRIATAQQSGSRLVTIGLVLGVCTAAASWALPPDGLIAWAPTVLGVLASLVGGFGVLRLFAAWQLARR